MAADEASTPLKSPDQVIRYFLWEISRAEIYVAFSERFLKEEHDAYLKSLSDKKIAERFDHRRDLSADLGYTFPQLQRTSCLLILFSAFEENLDHLCRSLEQEKGLTLNVNDISGKGIDRSRKYLSKVAGWEVPSSNWGKIKDTQKIRNLFAHAAGYISKENFGNISEVVNRSQFLSIQSGARSRVVLKEGYLEDFLSVAKPFLEALVRRTLIAGHEQLSQSLASGS